MNILKKTLTSALLLTATTTLINAGSPTFEQNGVKEGNNKLSIGLYTSVPDEGDESISLNAQYGHFFSDDVEGILDVYTKIQDGETLYMLSPGANYYFAKTPTLTPYVGAQVYYFDGTYDGMDSTTGHKMYVGAHKFLNENAAITPELGTRFFEFTEYTETYLNIYLSYFFD